MALGIAALSISHINMTGRLDGLNLTALAPSLTTLDLGGTSCLRWFRWPCVKDIAAQACVLPGNNLSGMLTPLSQLKKLKYLDVNGNQCTSLSPCLRPLY